MNEILGAVGGEYRDKLKQLQLALTEKLQRLNAREFAYTDVASFFIIQNLGLVPFGLESTLPATAQAAFALQTDFSPELEQPVAVSLSTLLNSMQATSNLFLIPQWVQFLVRFRWTTYSNSLLSAISMAISLHRDVVATLRTENFFTEFVSKVGTFEKNSLMKIMEAAPELFLIPDFFPEVVTTPFVTEIRNHYLFNVIEKRQWEVVGRILQNGYSAALVDDKSHHFLLTMALGRSMPCQLVIRFFSARPFENCHPFQMLATRYPEIEQIHLLTHLATRESVRELLSKDAVLNSSAFSLPEVRELLKMVLFRDRMLLLWCRVKVEFVRRVPMGVLRGIALDYISCIVDSD